MVVNASEQIEKFQDFISTNYEEKLRQIISQGKKSLIVDFQDLAKFDPELSEQLLEDPEDTVKALEVSLEQFDIPQNLNIRTRINNLPVSQKILIKDIRSAHIDKLMYLEGIVRQSSDVRPQVTSAKFECPACGNTISILQIDTRFKEPSRCSCGRKGRFRLISKELVDAQRLIIEEPAESLDGGEQPKRISVFLKEDLVEPKMEKKTTPGSKIRIIGTIKEIPILLRSGAQSIRYDLMIESNYIEPIEETYEDIDITKEDEQEIKLLAKDPNVYKKFINSIAPSIYGHEDIKGALVLQLMGGIKKVKSDGTITRGDMHILLVGDPGAAKSSILQYMSKVAPKARYTAGKSSTAAGLTATIVKDEFLRGWALEAGAMVLANGGFIMIDELDKMDPEDRSALHEGMAQQTITISKANIQATLKCETTVLAAANPKLGRFDPYQPIAAQIDLPPTLINRFDLIFPVRDIPNLELDEKIASHVLESHQDIESKQPEVAIPLMKKYVAYARRIKPKLSDAAISEIKSFYVNLRNKETAGDENIKPIPISARQLEELIRLAEGSARLRLSQQVTKLDAKRSIELLKHCLMQVGFDYETGQIDIDRIGTGITATVRNKIAIIREIITEIESRGKKTIAIEEIIAEASEKEMNEAQVEEVIEKLKRSGDIFEPRRGFIQKI